MAWVALAAILAIPLFHGEAGAQAACRTGECDQDGDGVPVERDGCPYTPTGGRALFDGCSTTDLARHPEVLLDPVGRELRETATMLRGDRSLRGVASRLDQSAVRLEQVGEILRTGRLCDGRKRYDKVVKLLRKSESDLGRRLAKLEAEAARDLAPVSSLLAPGSLAADEGDHRGLDQEILRLTRIGQIAGEAFARGFAASEVLGDACEAVVGRVTLSGVVADVDDTAGIVLLADGRKIALGTSSPLRHVAPGIDVSIDGYELDDGTFYGDVGSTPSTTNPNLELSPFTCLDLMVVPFQPHLGTQVSQMTMLPLDGYQITGSDMHALEFRMWLTAVPKDSPFCKSSLPLHWKRHSFELFVRQEGEPIRLMAVDLSPGELASFPSAMKPTKDAEISVTARSQDCSIMGCDYFADISGTDEIHVKVLNTGAYCLAQYESVEFALEDVDFQVGDSTAFAQFQPATIQGIASLFLQVDPGTNPVFQAEAYEIENGVSSYPNPELIGEGTPFAIYQNHDFVWDYMLYPFELTGVRNAVGLRWPRVIGLRNGKFIQYHCDTPGDLVRDVIDLCPAAAPDSYYRLPFSPGLGSVTQGNNGSFTHNGNQKFAFDFTGFIGEVRAARGGIVTSVVESIPSSSNCYNASTTPQCLDSNNPGNGCDANMVTIRHQDGTEGQYFHMPLNGVLVNVGDRVRRGQKIALVGNTGCSSGTHLHFHSVVAPNSSETVQMRFEQQGADCTIPASNSQVVSNNPKY